MECNKDDAIAAKEIAEKRMTANDFEGARSMALKAQILFPELDNISQILSICDVHCSAQPRIAGTEKDWYKILQVQRLADETAIKKQYRRLALILHPDKNRFPGAESAFKLICAAYAVLSDSTKKSLYDSKVQTSVRSAPVNKPAQVNKQSGAWNNVANGSTSRNQQSTGPKPLGKEDVFWTICPYCNIKYQYHSQFINRSLRCPNCMKPFMAFEIKPRANPLGPKKSQPGANLKPGSSQTPPQPKEAHNPVNFKIGVQTNKTPPAAQAGPHGIFNKTATKPEPAVHTGSGSEGVTVASNFKKQEDSKANVAHKANHTQGGNTNGAASNKETGNTKKKSKKRNRKHVIESSESLCLSSDFDSEDVTMKDMSAGPEIDSKSARRSLRRKHNVAYNESDNDDLPNSFKSSHCSKSPEDVEGEQKNVSAGEASKFGSQKSFPTDADTGQPQKRKNLDIGSDNAGQGVETVESKIESDVDSYFSDDSDKDKSVCPDPEFNDFDKERDSSRFKVDQYWACYDPTDGMPRFYAKVTKACASPFNMTIRWLEAVPINEKAENWVAEELPVGCGTYKFGDVDHIDSVDTFSHQVKEVKEVVKGRKRVSFTLYPKKGEVWALFKDWDMGWSLDPSKHKEFKYEVVEVLSDFVEGVGIQVGFLDKVAGFVSLFQRTGEGKEDCYVIRPDEVYKFSHCISYFKMSGAEKVGVPVGSFELDPASLPLKPDDLHFPRKAKTNAGDSPSKSTDKNARKDFVDLDGPDEISRLRKSPRGAKLSRAN